MPTFFPLVLFNHHFHVQVSVLSFLLLPLLTLGSVVRGRDAGLARRGGGGVTVVHPAGQHLRCLPAVARHTVLVVRRHKVSQSYIDAHLSKKIS